MTQERGKNHQSLLESIINFSDDAIISKTLDGIITSWNKGAEKIFGYTASEIIGKHISVLIPKDRQEEEEAIIGKITTGDFVKHYETQRLKKNGEIIYISLTVSPIKDHPGAIIGASKIAKDITEQKKAESERLKMLEDIVQRNKDLEQFSYIVSHNLRAPVANLLGIADLMEKGNLTMEEKIFLMQGFTESVKKLDNVIIDLNLITQVRNSVNECKEQVNFIEMVNYVIAGIDNLAKNNNVNFKTDFTAIDTFCTVKNYMHSIFYNLITNSIKYKNPVLPLVLEIKSEMTENVIRLTFKDNGIGIDLEKSGDQLFKLYKRFHIGAAEGKGMGLFMVKTHVESLGGKISVNSEVNVGTVFLIEFPFTDMAL